MNININNCLIVGTGLIGGSLALALKKANAVTHVIGIDRDQSSAEEAQALGLIDAVGEFSEAVIPRCDVIVLAVPVAQTAAILSAILPYLSAHTVITDVGSVKSRVVQAAHSVLKDKISQFVPAHPIAGSDQSGPQAALADLYQHKKCIITALPETSLAAQEMVAAMWQSAGATVSVLTPEEHDAIFAAVSHLPQLLSYAFMDDIAEKKNALQLLDFAGTGFKGFTRLAGSSPEMWKDISLGNRQEIVPCLDSYIAQLLRLRSLLAHGDEERLMDLYRSAQTARQLYEAEMRLDMPQKKAE